MTADQEIALAEEIIAAEDQAREAVLGTPVESMLGEGRTGRERTRGKDTERLGEAVAALHELARDDRALRPRAERAREHWMHSAQLCWQLALSARDVVRAEAAKLACPRLEREDLFQEGTVGLMHAARRFEPGKGVRFRTYARWWVRAQMRKAIGQSRPIRLPASATKLLSRIRKRVEQGHQRGQDIRPEQAAADLGVDPARASYLVALRQPDSLHEPVDGDPTLTREGTLADERQPDPVEQVAQREDAAQLRTAFDEVLGERSQAILARRYGLGDQERETLSAIGKDYDITPQRVRQIQREAERQLADWCAENRQPVW